MRVPVEKIKRHVQDAVARGATVLTGGRSVRNDVADGPKHYEPTVLVNATREMLCSTKKPSGPVVPLIRFREESMSFTRPTTRRLVGRILLFARYRADLARRRRLETAVVGINEGALASEAAPFAGSRSQATDAKVAVRIGRLHAH